MDDKMKKEIFGPYAKVAVLTIFIFLSGIMFGIILDNIRLSEIKNMISESEINSNDAIVLSLFLNRFGKSECEKSLKYNLEFNNKIYNEGREIESFIISNKFTPEIIQEWRRYVILQTQFLFNSMELKETCGFNYHNVIHFSKMKVTDPNEKAINKLQSEIMLKLKEKCGNKIMLIPISVDLDLSTVNALVSYYNITEYPAIVIDDIKVFQGLTSLEEINEITKC